MSERSTPAPVVPRPRLQLQTIDARRQMLFGGVGMLAVASAYAGYQSTIDASWRDWSTATIIAVAFVLVVGRALKRSGLYVLPDGRLLSRGLYLDFDGPRPARTLLQIRRTRFGAELQMRSTTGGLEISGMRLGPGNRLRLPWPRGRNEVLVREAPPMWGRRGAWQRTGIVWTDDDTFLDELAAYLDVQAGVAAPATTGASGQ